MNLKLKTLTFKIGNLRETKQRVSNHNSILILCDYFLHSPLPLPYTRHFDLLIFQNKKKDKSGGGGVGGSGQTPNGDGVNEDEGDDDVVYGNGDGTNGGASEGETTFHTAVEE